MFATPKLLKGLIDECPPLNVGLVALKLQLGDYAKHMDSRQHKLLTANLGYDLAAYGIVIYNLDAQRREDPYDFEFFNKPGAASNQYSTEDKMRIRTEGADEIYVRRYGNVQPKTRYYTYIHEYPRFCLSSGKLLACRSMASFTVTDALDYINLTTDMRARDSKNFRKRVLTRYLPPHNKDSVYTSLESKGVDMFGRKTTSDHVVSSHGTMRNSGALETNQTYINTDLIKSTLRAANEIQTAVKLSSENVDQEMVYGENIEQIGNTTSSDDPYKRIDRACANITVLLSLQPSAVGKPTTERLSSSTVDAVQGIKRTVSTTNTIATSIQQILCDLKYDVEIHAKRSIDEITVIGQICNYKRAKTEYCQYYCLDPEDIDDTLFKEYLKNGEDESTHPEIKRLPELAQKKVDRANVLSEDTRN